MRTKRDFWWAAYRAALEGLYSDPSVGDPEIADQAAAQAANLALARREAEDKDNHVENLTLSQSFRKE